MTKLETLDLDLRCNALLSGRDGYGELSPEIIYLQYPQATCCICGKDDLSRWGVPIDTETALICANDYEGDWAAKPACKECWAKHDAGQFVGHAPRIDPGRDIRLCRRERTINH